MIGKLSSRNFCGSTELDQNLLAGHLSRRYAYENDDEMTIQLLGIRLFNAAASSIKLMLSGYYQTAAGQMRDLLETTFLLDYFQSNRPLITDWRTSDDRARWNKFKPVKIREALDARDGFEGKKRGAAYSLLSELASHASTKGFRMLTPIPGGDAHCGPFFEKTSLDPCLSELAKILVQAAGTFTRFFTKDDKHSYGMKIGYMEAQGEWLERFYNHPFDRAPIEELRTILARLSG